MVQAELPLVESDQLCSLEVVHESALFGRQLSAAVSETQSQTGETLFVQSLVLKNSISIKSTVRQI